MYLMSEFEIPVPNYEDPKELYAFFGLTFYYAQVLEQGILNLAVGLEGNGLIKLKEGDLIKLYEQREKHTFGRVLKYVQQATNLSESQTRNIKEGLAIRNHLAHEFFAENSVRSLSESGQRDMIDELVVMLHRLIKIDSEFDALCKSEFLRLGLTQEAIDLELEKINAEARDYERAEKA